MTEIVVIGGAGLGPRVWDRLQATLGRSLTHFVLPGFAGTAPDESELPLAAASERWRRALDQRDAVVLMAHSLGVDVALRLADHPAVRGLVLIDGYPALAELRLGKLVPAERQRRLASMRQRIASLTPDALGRWLCAELESMHGGPLPEAVLAEASATDAATLGRALAEHYESDHRPRLAHIDKPALLVLPVGSWGEGGTQALAQYDDYPDLELLALPDARHFPMLDAVATLAKAIDAFIAAL